MARVKVRFCVAGLPRRTDSYGWACSFQDGEVLDEIRESLPTLGNIQQVVFRTEGGDLYEDLFVSYRTGGVATKKWYHVYYVDWSKD